MSRLHQQPNPPPVCHRRQGGDSRAISRIHPRTLRVRSDSESDIKQYGLEPDQRHHRGELVCRGGLLQLAEPEGGSAQGAVVLCARKSKGYAKGMTDTGRCLAAPGLSATDGGGMGVRVPVGDADEPVLREHDEHSWSTMRGIRRTREIRAACKRCGRLLPNDLGLFDMLGNVYEWCQDRYGQEAVGKDSSNDDIIDDIPRLLRGGAFSYRPANVRSANRNGSRRRAGASYNGFRLARTYY